MIEQENQNIGYLHLTNISNKVPLRVNKVQYKNLIPDDIRDQYSDYIDYDINLIDTTTCTDGQYLGETYNGDTEEWEHGIYEDSNYSITDYIAIDPAENQYGFYGLLEPDYDDPAYDHWYDANVEVYNSSKVRINTTDVSSFDTWINNILNNSEGAAYIRISFVTAQKNNIRLCKIGVPNNYTKTIDFMLDDNYPVSTDETSSWRASTAYAVRYCNDNMFGSDATYWEHEYPYSKHNTSYNGLLSTNLWKKQFTEIQDQDLESLNIEEFLRENSLDYVINDSDNSIFTCNYSDEYKTVLVYSSTIAFPAGEYWFSSDINAGFLIYNSNTGVEEFVPFDEFNSSIEIYSLNDINNGPEVLLGRIDKDNKKINFNLLGEDRLNIYFKFHETSIPSTDYGELSTTLKISMDKTMLSRTDKDYVVAVSKKETITYGDDVGGNERFPIIHEFINDEIISKQYRTTPGFVCTSLSRLDFQLDEEYTNDILYVWKCTPSQQIRESEQIYHDYLRYVETINSNMNYEFISNMDGVIRVGLFKTRALSEYPDTAFSNYNIEYYDFYYPVEEYSIENSIDNRDYYYPPLTAPVILKYGNEANIFLMRCAHYYMQAECLSEDTLINTEVGLLPISKIKEGNKILVKNKFNKYVYQPVERVIKYKTKKINMIAIATENGIIKSTENHEFFTDRGILSANELKEDYHLIDNNNNLIPIKRITKFYYSNSITYDLVVKDNNYFIGKNKVHVKSTQSYKDYQKERRK